MHKVIKLQMEEVMSMIFHGIELVKELESSLPEKPPEYLSSSLDEIVKRFGEANERLKMLLEIKNLETAFSQSKPAIGSGSNQMLMQIEPSLMQDYWLRGGRSTSSKMVAVDGGGGRNLTETGGSSGGASGSSTPRQRRRKEEGEEQTVLVAALRTGNTDLPPDDNHTWRKYGQKEILGSRYPRAYYRCTHQKLYSCPAKKQVQRLNDDPFTFRVTYRGSHTCHIHSTTPTATTAIPMATSISPTTVTTTGHTVYYGLSHFDTADAMFGSSGVGSDMDFLFPSNDQSQHNQRYQQLEDSERDK